MTDEVKVEEPQIDKPTEEVVVEPPAGEIDVESIMAKLNELDKTTPEAIDGMATASKESGRLAQLLGAERKRNEQLQVELNQSRNTPQPRPTNDFDLDNYAEGQPVDIEKAVESAVERVVTKREKIAQEANQRSFAEQQSILTDKNYQVPEIRATFEAVRNDPATMMQLQTGQTTLSGLWNNVKDSYKDNLLAESRKVIDRLSGKSPAPPHVERGGRTPENLVQEQPKDDARTERVKALKDKVNKGGILTEEEELEVIGLI